MKRKSIYLQLSTWSFSKLLCWIQNEEKYGLNHRASQVWPTSVSTVAPSAFSLPCISYACLYCSSSQSTACLHCPPGCWQEATAQYTAAVVGTVPDVMLLGPQESGMSGPPVNWIWVYGWLQYRVVFPFLFQIVFLSGLQPDSFPPIRLLAMWVSQSWKSCCSLIPHWNTLYRDGDISELRSEPLNYLDSHSLKCSAALGSVKLVLNRTAQDSALLDVMIFPCFPKPLLVWLPLSQLRQSRVFNTSFELEGFYLCSFIHIYMGENTYTRTA